MNMFLFKLKRKLSMTWMILRMKIDTIRRNWNDDQ